jgi:hypothetical protein
VEESEAPPSLPALLVVDEEDMVPFRAFPRFLRLASGGPRISAMKNAWRNPVGVVNMANTLRRSRDASVSGRCSGVSAILFRLLPATPFTSG